ncbi:MAG TPA: alpha/beta fold hydrolase [Gammaproteobacteria bacterium]|nr:alpha/beta fold hydrolase [Gammaproteobacteria bacterium]
MRRFLTSGALCAAMLIAAGANADAAEPATAAISFHTCELRATRGITAEKARCGTLTVPEDRAKPHGRQIKLFVAVLPALAAKPAPDPLFFIAGGPGESAVDGYFAEAGAFDSIRKQRDIVLVDQRGTGKSAPLECPAQEQAAAAIQAPNPAQQKALVKACLEHLSGDPRYYTTSAAIADLDAVRAALGAKEINLYGISYGTRVALEYLRYYGAHVRSVVLDGVVPADLALGPQVSVNAQRALKLVFDRCAHDKACAAHFPALPEEFARLNAQLRAHPAKLTLPDPLTGAPRTVTLTQDAFASGVRLLTYTSETVSLLPLLIHQAAAGDPGPLANLVSMINSDVTGSMSQGMQLSVVCTEDVPFYQPAQLETAAARDTYLGSQTLDALENACRVWPRGVIRDGFKQPVVSAKPVLLISGADDPITPPKNAVHAAKTLNGSLSIVVPGQGHGNAFRGCLPRVMAQFVAAASVKGLDTGCVKRIRPAPFFSSYTGPAP